MQIANQTLPIINIPAQLTPYLPSTGSQLGDAGTITGIIGIITGAYASIQNHRDDAKSDLRTEKMSNAQLHVVNSLKETDVASQEDSHLSYLLITALEKHPEVQKILSDPANGKDGKSILDIAAQTKQGWDSAIKQYYNSSTPNPDEFVRDPVVRKTAEVINNTTPAPTT